MPVAPVGMLTNTGIVNPLTSIATFIQAAKDKGLKFPKARFLAPAVYGPKAEMVLKLTGPTSKYRGAVSVTINGEWIGYVTPSGVVIGGLKSNTAVLDILQAIASAPADAAKAYGALTCSCSFCGKALTDAGSVEVGYGPICADKWNLPHTAKGTPTLATFKQVATVKLPRNASDAEILAAFEPF
jgi:hypothetical protein